MSEALSQEDPGETNLTPTSCSCRDKLHQLGGLKRQAFILYGSGHQKSEILFPGLKLRATRPPEALEENARFCFFSFFRATFFAFISIWPLPQSSKPTLEHLASIIVLAASSVVKSPSASLL